MTSVPKNVRNALKDFRRAQENLIEHYESKKHFEMSYIAQWAILEHGVKSIAVEYRRALLLESLDAWKEHLMRSGPKPNSAPSTVLEKATLPPRKELHSALKYYGIDAAAVWQVMDSRGRYRRHRNEIAHTGKRFVNHVLYQDLMRELKNVANVLYKTI